MATPNDTRSREKSKPEKVAQWLFSMSGNYRHILGFILIVALTVISIRFNYELGKLSAVDETSEELLPFGYALLDLCALFLSGYVGIKSTSLIRRGIAWGWFGVLLSLSLWAAASFTLSVDSRLANSDLTHAIEQKRLEVESLNVEVSTWRDNVAQAVNFKTKHQNTLNGVQARQSAASDELHALEKSLVAPTMAIYEKAAPYTPLDADTLSLVVRLIWAGAMTLSPLVIVLLVVAEFETSKAPTPQPRKTEPTPKNKKDSFFSGLVNNGRDFVQRQKLRCYMRKIHNNAETQNAHKLAQVSNSSTSAPVHVPANQQNSDDETPHDDWVHMRNELEALDKAKREGREKQAAAVSNVVPIKGHNQHTETLDLNGLKYAIEWLARQEAGRVTRAQIGFASKIKSKVGVRLIVHALLERGLIVRLANKQLYKKQKRSAAFR